MPEDPSVEQKWCWAEHPDAESWKGPFDSRQQAEDYGRRWEERPKDDDYVPGTLGYVATATPIRPEEWITAGRQFEVEEVLEGMEESLGEEWPCFDDAVFEIPAARLKEAQDDLMMVLKVWAEKYVDAGGHFVVTGDPQEVKP